MAALSNRAIVDSLPIPTKHTPHQSVTSPRHSIERSTLPDPSNNHHNHTRRHASSASVSAIPRSASQRSPSGIFQRAAAAALDSIASISEPVIRPKQSNPALTRLSLVSNSSPDAESFSSTDSSVASSALNSPSTHSLSSDSNGQVRQSATSSGAATTDPSPAQSPVAASPPAAAPPPHPATRQKRSDSKMHQTSSRLLRMTDDERPFTRVSPPQSHHCHVQEHKD